MPNPGGVNQFDHFAKEPPQGEVTALTQATQAAPGPGGSIQNTPRRLQRAAGRGGQAQPAPAGQPTLRPMATSVPYPVALAQAWREIAQTPGVSDEVLALAEEAQRGR